MAAGDNGSVPGLWEALRRGLRGDGQLPVGEALHPVTLLALGVLLLNDWVLKPRLGPSAITGKLSDLAGLILAPVVLSSLIGLGLYALAGLGARIDARLSRRRLLACIAATGVVFTAIKLSERAATWFTAAIGVFHHAEVYLDRTDLLCLPVLAISGWIGRDELRRLGRHD